MIPKIIKIPDKKEEVGNVLKLGGAVMLLVMSIVVAILAILEITMEMYLAFQPNVSKRMRATFMIASVLPIWEMFTAVLLLLLVLLSNDTSRSKQIWGYFYQYITSVSIVFIYMHSLTIAVCGFIIFKSGATNPVILQYGGMAVGNAVFMGLEKLMFHYYFQVYYNFHHAEEQHEMYIEIPQVPQMSQEAPVFSVIQTQ